MDIEERGRKEDTFVPYLAWNFDQRLKEHQAKYLNNFEDPQKQCDYHPKL